MFSSEGLSIEPFLELTTLTSRRSYVTICAQLYVKQLTYLCQERELLGGGLNSGFPEIIRYSW